MLDLNIDAADVSLDNSACDETNLTLSGASSSVIVAADEESNSSSATHTTLKFSILNSPSNIIQIVDDDDDGGGNDDQDQVSMTRPLFPVHKNESFSLTAAKPQQWLKLSVPEAAVGVVGIGMYNKGHQQQQQVSQAQPQQQQPVKKSRRGPRSRSSQYRGVTFYRRTGRWESHIWDCGKQVYLGGFDTAHSAARAYDRAAIQFRGVDADINFQISDYEEDMKQLQNLTKDEFVQILRRQSSGFSRGSSKYRGVTLHKCGRWEARMGQLLGKKAYDKAAIRCNGREAVTNFEHTAYEGDINRAVKNGGGGDNLDLNLWISPASDGLKEIGDSRSLSDAVSELPDGKRLKVESSFTAHDGLAIASLDSSAWIRSYSGFGPNIEKRARNMRPEGIPLPGLSNWPWKMQCNGVITSVPLFSSSAASSGFSTNITYLSSNTQKNNMVHTSAFQHPPMTINYN